MRPATPTLGSPLCSASLCRANNWGPATHLWQHDARPGERPACLRINAIGDRLVIGREIDAFSGEPIGAEDLVDLSQRDWRPEPPAPALLNAPTEARKERHQTTTDDARCTTTHQSPNPTPA